MRCTIMQNAIRKPLYLLDAIHQQFFCLAYLVQKNEL